jgi:hypothetical protein
MTKCQLLFIDLVNVKNDIVCMYIMFFHPLRYSNKTNVLLPKESIINCHQLSSIMSLITRDKTLTYRQTYNLWMDKAPQYVIYRVL